MNRFEFQIPELKTTVEIVKSEDGDKENLYIYGLASGTDIDLHGDRMDKSAIESMKNSLNKHLDLRAEHDPSWHCEIGEITELTIDKDSNLFMKASLDIGMSKARDLWHALTVKGKKLGLSIGGFVKSFTWNREEHEGEERLVRVFQDVELDHIGVVSSPAYPKAWVTAIQKSLDNNLKEENMNKPLETEDKNLPEEDSVTLENGEQQEQETVETTEVEVTEEKAEKAEKSEKSEDSEEKETEVVEVEAEKSEDAKEVEEVEEVEETEVVEDDEAEVVEGTEEAGESKESDEAEVVEDEVEEVEEVTETEVEEKTAGGPGDEEEKTEKSATNESLEVTKTLEGKVSELSEALTKSLEVIENLQSEVKELKKSPTPRKGVEVTKGLGAVEDGEATVTDYKEALELALKEIEKQYPYDAEKQFVLKQKVRNEFARLTK